MASSNRSTFQSRLALVVAGIGKRLQQVPTLTLVGVTYTPAQAIQLFQSAIASAAEVASTKAKWLAAIEADRVLNQKVHLALLDLQSLVRILFGNAVDPLADFGIAPKKATGRRTGAVVVAAAAKAKATRVARHTLSKKQKLAIKGVVSVPVAAGALPGTGPSDGVPALSSGPAVTPAGGVASPQSNGSAPHA